MIVLLGAQQAEPSLPHVLAELGVKGPVALVTAGWQEREGEPGLAPAGVPTVELALHARGEQVFAADGELAELYQARQLRLKLMQDFYRVRLEHAAAAARAVSVRSAEPALALAEEEHAASLEVIRFIDRAHVERCRAVHAAFEARAPHRRPVVAAQIGELRAQIAPTAAIVIAGGHVAVLLNRLRLFGIAELAESRPIIAWSAGAMALTERVVLFHDDPPHGQAISEILDAGLGLAPDLVALPEPRQRLRLDDGARVSELAQRYAPAACIALDPATQLWLDGGNHGRPARAVAARRLASSGQVEAWP